MIDTDKYEGHTPAPWKASHDVLEYGHIVNNNGWRVYVGEHEKRAVIENRTFMHDDLSEANAQLIADAPLLLEEVKRLQKALHTEQQIVQAFYEYRDECCFDHCEKWMLEKGYRVIMSDGLSEWSDDE